MKIEYTEKTCVGCLRVSRTLKDSRLPIQQWIMIKTEGASSTSMHPRLDAVVCSIECFRTFAIHIEDLLTKNSIPRRKHIQATVCDYCGKIAKTDSLDPIIGPGPLRDWIVEHSGNQEKHFCSLDCRKKCDNNPEQSVRNIIKWDENFGNQRLLSFIVSRE